ncbi:MAG TPA: carbohydrate ABC transporter permease [Phycisphaerae bacterium]|jgi:multiple sugar transport system permease protein
MSASPLHRRAHPVAIGVVLIYTAITLLPILFMLLTSFKEPSATTKIPPGILPIAPAPPGPPGPPGSAAPDYFFVPTLQNYRDQFSTPEVLGFVLNSTVVAIVTTLASVGLGTLAAYGFSRFKMAGSANWQFFILSTRMLPAMAVSVPIAWMYQQLGLRDTWLGLIILYTCFNLSFSTWMMKAFIDEIPTAYEEAALLDGYTRMQVFRKIILPEASTGILATAVFCLIAAWNEYAFAVTLTTHKAQTLPVYIAAVAGAPQVPFGRLAAGAILFVTPIVLFTLLMRKHLLRGITFGAVKG